MFVPWRMAGTFGDAEVLSFHATKLIDVLKKMCMREGIGDILAEGAQNIVLEFSKVK